MSRFQTNSSCYLCFDYAFDEDFTENSRFQVEVEKYNQFVLQIEKKKFRQLSVQTNLISRTLFHMRLKIKDSYLLDHEEITFNISSKNLSAYYKKSSYTVKLSHIFSSQQVQDISIHKVLAISKNASQDLQPVVITTKQQKANQQDIIEFLRKTQFYLLQKENNFKLSFPALDNNCEVLSTVSSQRKKFKRAQRDKSLEMKIKASKRDRLNIEMQQKEKALSQTSLQDNYKMTKFNKSMRRSLLNAHSLSQEKTQQLFNVAQIKKNVIKITYPIVVLLQFALMTYLMFPGRKI